MSRNSEIGSHRNAINPVSVRIRANVLLSYTRQRKYLLRIDIKLNGPRRRAISIWTYLTAAVIRRARIQCADDTTLGAEIPRLIYIRIVR